MTWRRQVVVAAGMCVLVACGGGKAEPAATPPSVTPSAVAQSPSPSPSPESPESSPPATGPVPVDAPFASDTVCSDPATSSRAVFDPRGGRYPAFLYGVNTTQRTIAFDIVQVLAGDDAVAAYHRDNPSDPGGPPNGAHLVNAFVHTDPAPLAGSVGIRRSGYGESPVLVAGTLAELLESQGVGHSKVYWLTFRDGTVTELCRDLRSWSTVEEGPLDANHYDRPPGAEADCSGAGTSSRADFDPRSGVYAVYLYGVDTTLRTVAFDVIQQLVGEDAVRVWEQEDHPDDPNGPPNDYLIVNAYENTDEAVVAGDVRVWLHHPSGTVAPADFADIVTEGVAGRHPGYGFYWLTFSNGTVTDICQQFTP